MNKFLYSLIITLLSPQIFADTGESTLQIINTNDTYINPNAYIQNPWITSTSAGGTQNISESQTINQNFAEKLFADGTWNFFGTASAQYTGSGAGFPNYAYGASFFAQTGQVAGFSVGGLFEIINPLFVNHLNGYNANMSPFLPSNEQVTTAEAFVEYQYSNIVQVDAGLIGINNSPWLSLNYYNNMMSVPASYQGILINVDPGAGWLLTALAFNGAQGISETGFTNLTWYNKGYDYSGGNISNNTTSETSNGTVSLGANYVTWNNQYNLRLWAYEFENYGELFYADNSIKFKPTTNLAFNIAAQGGSNTNGILGAADGTNALTNAGYGQISSNFIGLQTGLSYQWFSLNLSYNNVWGNQNAYGSGAIVTPYTYGMATDPLYTTPYMAGLADLGTAGTTYKVSPSFNFLDNNLSIAPAFTTFSTALGEWNGTNEYDFLVTYSIPQIKGLSIFGVYAYQQVPQVNTTGNTYITQLFISYLY